MDGLFYHLINADMRTTIIVADKSPLRLFGLYITSCYSKVVTTRRMGSLWGCRLLGRCPADDILSAQTSSAFRRMYSRVPSDYFFPLSQPSRPLFPITLWYNRFNQFPSIYSSQIIYGALRSQTCRCNHFCNSLSALTSAIISYPMFRVKLS